MMFKETVYIDNHTKPVSIQNAESLIVINSPHDTRTMGCIIWRCNQCETCDINGNIKHCYMWWSVVIKLISHACVLFDLSTLASIWN
jgi:hypothetical protein